MIKHLRSTIRDMLWLFRIWLFVRFVNEQDVKLHEHIRAPEMKEFRGHVRKGFVHKDSAIVAYASKHRMGYLRKISEGRAAHLCEAALIKHYIMETNDTFDHMRSIVVTSDPGTDFAGSFFGFIEELYKIFPKATWVVFGGGSGGIVVVVVHLIAKALGL